MGDHGDHDGDDEMLVDGDRRSGSLENNEHDGDDEVSAGNDRPSGSLENLTRQLRAWGRGDRAVFDRILPLIYDELRRRAARYLRRERPDHTEGPTSLVSALYEKLCAIGDFEFHNRAHFFAVVSNMMRRILVDHARRRRAEKRGAGERPVEIDPARLAIERPWELAALGDALDELARRNSRVAQIIELHYFGGLTQHEIAELCGIHPNTVARDLRFGKAWLRSYLRAEI